MAVTDAKVSNFLLQLKVFPSILSRITKSAEIKLPYSFSSVEMVREFSGTYTPDNDLKTIWSVAEDEDPNFMMLILDKPANLFIQNQNLDPNIYQPVRNIFMMNFDSGVSFRKPLGIILDGTEAASPAMQQGVAVNYYLLGVRATVT
jgi:hypothetical protein